MEKGILNMVDYEIEEDHHCLACDQLSIYVQAESKEKAIEAFGTCVTILLTKKLK